MAASETPQHSSYERKTESDCEQKHDGRGDDDGVDMEVEVVDAERHVDDTKEDTGAQQEEPRDVERRRVLCSDEDCEFVDYEATVPTANMGDASVWSDERKQHVRLCHPHR